MVDRHHRALVARVEELEKIVETLQADLAKLKPKPKAKKKATKKHMSE